MLNVAQCRVSTNRGYQRPGTILVYVGLRGEMFDCGRYMLFLFVNLRIVKIYMFIRNDPYISGLCDVRVCVIVAFTFQLNSWVRGGGGSLSVGGLP